MLHTQTKIRATVPDINAKDGTVIPVAYSPAEGLYGKQALFAMIGIALVILLSALDQTIVSTALPQVIADLHGFDYYAWVATAYLLTSTVTIPIMGKISDLYGRKYFLLASIVIFTGASALAGAAGSMLVLIIARAIQGIGSGMLIATAFSSVGDMFPQPERRARWQGILTGTFGLASVIGPSLGGIMTDTLGWRSVFYVNLPIGIVTIFVLWYMLPANLSPRMPHARIDWAGACTITIGVSMLLFAIEQGGSSWLSPTSITLLLLSLIILVAFILIECQVSEPLFPLDLLLTRTVALCSAISLGIGFALFGLIFYTPLFAQGVLGMSASAAGLLQTPLVVSMAVGSLLSGQIFGRTGRLRPLMVSGSTFFLVGTLLVAQTTETINHTVFGIELGLSGLGIGMMILTIMVTVQAIVPRHRLGVGTSTIQFLRQIGSTLGTAIIGALVNGLYTANLMQAIPSNTNPSLTALLNTPQALINQETRSQAQTLAQQIGADGLAQLHDILVASRLALATGIGSGYWLAFGVAIVTFALVWFLGDPIQAMRSKAHACQQEEEPASETIVPVR